MNSSKKKKRFVSFGGISRISYDPTILYDSTWSYNFYDPSVILNVGKVGL